MTQIRLRQLGSVPYRIETTKNCIHKRTPVCEKKPSNKLGLLPLSSGKNLSFCGCKLRGSSVMESNGSKGLSWADQWDYSPYAVPETKKSHGGGGGGGAKDKYSRKVVEEGFGKTKVAASTGMKKVKEGASVGLHWIKDKYQKTTQKR